MAIDAGQLALALRLVTDATDAVPSEYADVLERLLGVTEALVDSYAPNAPPAVRDEARIRLAGYLYDRPPESASAGAMHYSGAQGLLAPYHAPPTAAPATDERIVATAIVEGVKAYAVRNGRAIDIGDLANAIVSRLIPDGGAAGDVLQQFTASTAWVAALNESMWAGRVPQDVDAADFTDPANRGGTATMAVDGVAEPTWTVPSRIAIAVPSTQGLREVLVGGFDQIGAFAKRGETVTLNDVMHEVWLSNAVWSARASGTAFTVRPFHGAGSGWGAPPSSPIDDGSVTVAKLAAAVVARIAPALAGNGGKFLAVNNAASAVELVDAPSGSGDIADDSVTTDKLADDSVTTDKLADDSVTGAKIPNGTITSLKIAARAVTNAEIGPAAVTEAEIATGAVKTAKIEASAVTIAKLSSPVVSRIAPSLTGNGGKFLAVNNAASAVELVDAPSGGGSSSWTDIATFTLSSSNTSVVITPIPATIDDYDWYIVEHLSGRSAPFLMPAGADIAAGASKTVRVPGTFQATDNTINYLHLQRYAAFRSTAAYLFMRAGTKSFLATGTLVLRGM